MKILLFDIDGTLLNFNGLGRSMMSAAVRRCCGQRVDARKIRFSGRTDREILREIIADTPLTESDLPSILDVYCGLMEDVAEPALATLLPGVVELLEWLSDREDVSLGLLTGNVKNVAYLKLSMAGLDTYFSYGAFGCDNSDRYALPLVALERARSHLDVDVEGSQLVIIGDTEHDIRCGRGVGAMSVAVCTGQFGREQLARHSPHVLLDDLSDRELFAAEVLGSA